ncbi:hypothetical protein GCM10009007_04460 [Formosimonas limnophila]|uniref:DUF2272 domain-containing protein n=1 Tax=Formosimonas limnophila TaxID=1384487 RepID=A0A8J3CM66_9BURK|nr:hypothetical protein GCM10009007_04460 [Formosimonas limnophila]
MLWGRPFINAAGHLIQIGPMEGETDKLANGESAWQRVLHYWTASVGAEYLYHPDDVSPDSSQATKNAFIRTRLIDNPWSGVFVSYVMKTAGFSADEFTFNDGHIRYIKPAFTAALSLAAHEPNAYAYVAKNPLTTPMAVGDLICYTREGRDVYGPMAFFEWLQTHQYDGVSLKTHCDIVVTVKKSKAYTIGGNVVQSVVMRELTLNKQGALAARHTLPITPVSGSWVAKALTAEPANLVQCEPVNGRDCDMNRKDWVVLLKAK